MNFSTLIPPPYYFWFRWLISKLRFGHKVRLSYTAVISPKSTFEGLNYIGSYTYFKGEMGLGSYISSNSNLTAKIGRFSSIGPRVYTIQGRHPFRAPFASTSPFFFSPAILAGKSFVHKSYFKEYKYAQLPYFTVNIGSDCWIGADVKIISGVNINNGAVVLAGTVVTKDIPPYAIVGGVPGKILGYRYEENICNKLEIIKWWDKPLDWIEQNNHLLRDIDLLLNIEK